jgi:protein TonB
MTALAQPRIDRHDPLSPVRRKRSEKGVFAVALGVALALHLLALVLPLPSRPAPPPPEPPSDPGPRIWIAPLPPPDIPEPTVATVPPPERPIPVPMPEAPPQEPVTEPLAVTAIEPLGESLLPEEVGFEPGPPPPPEYTVLQEGTPGLVPPRLISKCADPEYPAMAVRVGLEGTVVLRALITEEGDVTSIELFQAPRPDFGFSESAIAAVSCWKYRPGLYRGRAVAVSMTVIVEFELD